ncbi:MAG: 50S ribosomal protein L1 [Planctomycetota bacterium]|jgi:large subunit ribosomal protein L1|nr:50S ribosomal protein L1 [Planctomycetota bacterium]
MPKFTKRQQANLELVPETPVSAAEAIKVLKSFKETKFDQSINVVASLGINPKQADQALRGSISMPKGIGRSARVIAFCNSDKVPGAIESGAIEAGCEELVAKVAGGWTEFDVAIASPDVMRFVGTLGKVLGPKGLMPSPKAGTVTPDVKTAVAEFAAGKQEYRNDDGGNVHIVVGKMSFSETDLLENLMFFIETVEKIKPAAAKGLYFKKVVVSGTMTPGVQIAL